MKTTIYDEIAVDACMWVYGDENRLRRELSRKYRATRIKLWKVEDVDMEFCTFNINDRTWMAIRGTKGLKDIMTDSDLSSYDPIIKRIVMRKKNGKEWMKAYDEEIKFLKHLKKSFNFGQIHWGFFKCAAAIYKFMQHNNIKIEYLCGHSLGGGVAQILAMFQFDLKQIITFGSPRSGGFKFVKQYNKRYKKITRRFFNDKDIVPKIPLRIMMYFHVAKGLYFNPIGDLKPRMEQIRDFISVFKKYDLPENMKEFIANAKKMNKKTPEFLTDHYLDEDNPLGYVRNVRRNIV